MKELGAQVERRGGRALLVHLATFSGGLAAVGYVPAAFELAEQLRGSGARCDHLVVAVGSGGTYAGLLLGLRLAGVDAHVLGVSVSTPASALRRYIHEQVQAAAQILDVSSPVRDDDLDITDAHIGPGYGIPTEDSLAAIRLAAHTEGLLFDPTYTGKAWAALSHAVRIGAIDRGATVVFLHTGGAPILFAQAGALAPAAPARA
jgi:1-aminocyclopropane-1-carboxylate deaminase/D-cysteine desulfhydrase-like pyridoxal-dependent ACC family enzyme